MADNQQNQIHALADLIKESNRIVFFGGAGVSTESGIPDFRSESGIYRTVQTYGCPPEEILSHTFFVRKPEVFFDFYKNIMLYPDAPPNDAHLALARLEQAGKLSCVVTQNIDGLHQKAGSRVVHELHGSVLRNHCVRCGRYFEGLDIILEADGVPHCPDCGGIIKPDVVLYEESLNSETIEASVDAIQNADMLIVGGTSLNVYPAAGFVQYYRGGRMVLINKSETPYDRYADLLIHDSIGKVLKEAVSLALE